jgi:hypothetical protein
MNDTSNVANATIVYESMFGSTRRVAEAIAQGLGDSALVTVVPVGEAPRSFSDVDLLLVGAPTHVHGLSRPSTRDEAAHWGADLERHLRLEPETARTGMAEWLDACDQLPARFVAFDTRADLIELLSGSAAATIDKRMRKLGSRRLLEKESFLVDKQSNPEPGQLDRAREWGRSIAAALQVAIKG